MEKALDIIVRTAADDLRARGVQLVVVILPNTEWVEGSDRSAQGSGIADRMLESARKASVPALDAVGPLRAAFRKGVQPFIGANDGHFNAAGHEVMARWLLDALPRRRGSGHPAPDF